MAVSLPVLAALCALPAYQNPAAVPTKVRTAALFKNGLAFVLRSGVAPAGSATVRLDALPVPTHGTFWVASGAGTPAVTSVVARKTERVERVPATNVQELLLGNVGRTLTLVLSEKETLVGKLISMPLPRALEIDDEDRPRYGYLPEPVPSLLLLDTGSGISALDPHQVQRLSTSDGPPNRDFELKRSGRSLTIAFASAPTAPAPFELTYLERGLTWVPSYTIDISDTGKALLVAKADVIDESEDLEGATLSFVTGFPNLQFAHVADPIALRGGLEEFLNALAGGATMQQAQVLAQSVMSNSLASGRSSSSLPIGPVQEQGGAEDLFLYEQKDVTLAKGERGFYPLFQKRVPCEHVYEWKIPDTGLESYWRERERQREGREPPQEEIWHSLRLTNDTGQPWTTAPAMTQKSGNVLGQDTLRYTAVGALANVRITRALDIQGEQVENEVGRERNSAKFWDRFYDKVTVHGQLRVTDFKREAVKLEIEKLIQGEVTKNPATALVDALVDGYFHVNPTTRLRWAITLEPGKPLLVEYEYTIYVPS